MKISPSNMYLMILAGLLCCMIICGCLSPSDPTRMPEKTPVITVTITGSPATTSIGQQSGNLVSCTLTELRPELAMNLTVLEFSENLGTTAPELKRGMESVNGSSGSWFNGQRYAGTVTLDSDVNDIFCNSRNPSLDCINAGSVYSFRERYFSFVCTVQPVTNPPAGGVSAGSTG